MIERFLKQLSTIPGVQTHPGLRGAAAADLARQMPILLPVGHQRLLEGTNGIEGFWGHFRVFGVGSLATINSLAWNEVDCWKFAWGGRCDGFWCFGETAWGDQYAYRLEDLRSARDVIYLLDALSMSAEVLYPSFLDFLNQEILRCAQCPYDKMTLVAHKQFGLLAPSSHLVYSPSPLLGAEESIEHVQLMNARAAMIANGDVAIELDNGPPGGTPDHLEPYFDKQGRMRLRINWKPLDTVSDSP